MNTRRSAHSRAIGQQSNRLEKKGGQANRQKRGAKPERTADTAVANARRVKPQSNYRQQGGPAGHKSRGKRHATKGSAHGMDTRTQAEMRQQAEADADTRCTSQHASVVANRPKHIQ